jgi:hypothetical protein
MPRLRADLRERSGAAQALQNEAHHHEQQCGENTEEERNE